jgi:hypothetical protein
MRTVTKIGSWNQGLRRFFVPVTFLCVLNGGEMGAEKVILEEAPSFLIVYTVTQQNSVVHN